jgi:beta-lactamase regulating signal transducer with metallopeptidase domain
MERHRMAPLKWWLVPGLMAVMLISGCAKKTPDNTAQNLASEFTSANAELKAKIEFVVATQKTNNYVGAITTLQGIMGSPGLTQKQQKAVEDMFEALNTSLYAAVDKGDPNAIQANEALKALRQRGR